MKKANSKGDSWNQTVIRFRAQLDTLFHGGQPSGRLEPEMALARIDKLAKEDLKRSVSRFFTAFSFIVSLICQSGNSHSRTQRLGRENAPGMWRSTLKVYSGQSAQLLSRPELNQMRMIPQWPLSRGVSISRLNFDSTWRTDLDQIL